MKTTVGWRRRMQLNTDLPAQFSALEYEQACLTARCSPDGSFHRSKFSARDRFLLNLIGICADVYLVTFWLPCGFQCIVSNQTT
jgi:hypothetical protein